KLLAALLGFLIAITGAVSAQNRTTKRRIDFNASNNKERAQQGAPRHDRHSRSYSLFIVSCGCRRGCEAHDRRIGISASADFPNHTYGTIIYAEARSGMVSGDCLDSCRVWLE